MGLSNGEGQLVFDPVSQIPHIQTRTFGVIFLHYPWLGAVGDVENYEYCTANGEANMDQQAMVEL